MQIALVDTSPASRAALLGRVQEGVRQADVKKLEIVEVQLDKIEECEGVLSNGVLLGPGCFEQIDSAVERARLVFPAALIGVVVENEIYGAQAVLLRKRLNCHIIPLGDLAQIAGFLIDSEQRAEVGAGGTTNRGIVGVAQLKGGVGATSIVGAVAACWARHGLSVAAVDLDDVNPQLTEWGRVGVAQRMVTAELLRQGEVPASRLNEILHPVEGFEGRLVIVGQPERYNESFHFKADVLEGAPSASEFVVSLFEHLKNEFDAVIVDLSRSWGVGTFSALKLCQHVLLVTDDDGMSVRRTLDGLARLKRETDDPEELDLAKWSLVLNAYTGRLISPRDLAAEIRDMDLFPTDASLYTVPFSERGRQWGGPGQTLYDLAEDGPREVIQRIAYTLAPFRFEPTTAFATKLLKKWQKLIKSA